MEAMKHVLTGKNYVPAATLRIKDKDYFHLKNLYIMLHDWTIEEGFAPAGKDEDFPETFHMHRETQKSGTEMWIWWRLSKGTGNSYYLYEIDLDFHVILLKDAEVMHQGKKFKTNWGEIELKLWARVMFDKEGKWQKSPLLKHMDKIWHQRLFEKEAYAHRVTLYRYSYRLIEAVKTYLKLRTYLPEPELERWPNEFGLGEVQ